jgi:hypothetical protein
MKRRKTNNKKTNRKWQTSKRTMKNSTENLKNIEYLKEEYVEKGLDKMQNTFVLYRIIGNDLYPRHQNGQTLRNLKFILENESELENCEKRWIINRIFDKEVEQAVIEILTKYHQKYIHIPFLKEEYKNSKLDMSFLPTPNYLESKEFSSMNQERRNRILTAIRRNKNKYVMNVNGARNTALRDGRTRAKWILPWDGNCFVTQTAWKQIYSDVASKSHLKYFAVPMTRVLDNTQLLGDNFIPVPVEEPQLIFRMDANEEFNEDFWYGRRDKVELLWRLGIPGDWDYWKDEFWDSKRLPLAADAGQYAFAGWVARLFSGMKTLEKNSRQREAARFEAIIKTIQYLDNEILNNGIQTPFEHLGLVDDYFEKIKFAGYNKSSEVEVAFAISLKSRRSSRNWTRVQNNLARTLRSIINNTDQNYRILIAGHEKPNIKEMNHERVTWLPVTFSPPTSIRKYSSDKFRKRRVIGAYLRKSGFSGYFMPLDADDWVHHRFVEFIRSQPIIDAFVMNTGCMANMKSKQIWVRERFYSGCGSSAVFYFRNSDFPRTSLKRDVMKSKFKWVVLPHGKVTTYLKNKNYKMVNYPLVTWVVVHGDNNTIIKRKIKSSISARSYHAISENLQDWFYDYFKIK